MFFAGLTEGQEDTTVASEMNAEIGWDRWRAMYVNYVRGGVNIYLPGTH